FKRFALLPALEALQVASPVWLSEPAAIYGFESELIVEDFWATFPPWYIAIPFLGVCGFACVYFLGSKGFCAYGCPYGGMFGVMDRVSPGRIVVSDACEGCGHCTAVCTSNVRVHEEVRDFGAVVNSGCMKCLDCVSACPKDALSFGFSTPAILTKPREEAAKSRQRRAARSPRRYDLNLREDAVIAGVAFLCFLGYRGMFNLVPMLMAVGMALVVAYLVWSAYRTLKLANVRIQSMQLKAGGRIRPAGVLVILTASVSVAAAGWSASVNWMRWTAHLHHESLALPIAVALRPEFDPSPEQAAAVGAAIARYERSASIRDHGMGWSLRPQDRRELAFLYVLDDRLPEAIEQLELLAAQGEPTTELLLQQTNLRRMVGEPPSDIAASLEAVLELHPDLHDVRVEWSRIALSVGTPADEVRLVWDEILARDGSAEAKLAAARALADAGDSERARGLLAEVATTEDAVASIRISAARRLASFGDREAARATILSVAEREPRAPQAARELADGLATVGERERAMSVLDQAVVRFPDSASVRQARALLQLVEGGSEAALDDYAAASRLSEDNVFALAGIGEAIVRAGLGSRNREVLELGLTTMGRAAALEDHAILHHDHGRALMAARRLDDARSALSKALKFAPSNEAIARSARAIGIEG
ncbi:MAG: 4Fe-4S dicluster domain-containing protein, partial [Planctomycetota bacterium]